MASPSIHTYHCACTSLLLASTHTLQSLPRRAAPSLDQATILPLPSTPIQSSDSNQLSALGYTTLLSMTPDRRPTIIRREDGFEKRILWRCGRCRIVVGYELDEEHYSSELAELQSGEDGSGSLQGNKEERTKVLYVLPGWTVSTQQMMAGKKIGEEEAMLEPGQLGIAAWE